jgi:hypothetical protein
MLRLFSSLFLVLVLTATSQAIVILDEDFDDGSAGPFNPIAPGWYVEGGAYHCITNGFEVLSMSGVGVGDLAWSDYTASWDVMADGGTNHILLFRNLNYFIYYYVNLRTSPWNDIRFGRVINNDDVTLAVASCQAQNNAWHHFDLQVFGYSFAVSVDGVQVLSYTDTSMPDLLQASGISLVSYSGGVVMHQHIVYDNLRVETTEIAAEAITWGGVKALFQ